jgi:polyferredoxin
MHIIDNALHDWDKWNVKQIFLLFYVLLFVSLLSWFLMFASLVSFVVQGPQLSFSPSLDRLILQLAMLFHMSSAEMHARQIQI